MSTRCTVHFKDSFCGPHGHAIVYRHSDGYPEGAGIDLQKFLDTIKENLSDTRFDDPSFLAARYIVWLADQFREYGTSYCCKKNEPHQLGFISVGVCMEDPEDIEFRYEVTCRNLLMPEIKCFSIDKGDYVDIPKEVE